MVDPQTKTQGAFPTGREIELNAFNEIEISKGQFLMAFSSFSESDIQAQLIDILTEIESKLLEYFEYDEIADFRFPEKKVAGYSYNFFEYKSMIYRTDDKENLRIIELNAFVLYNRFKKKLKISINTEFVSGKKKSSIDSSFSQKIHQN